MISNKERVLLSLGVAVLGYATKKLLNSGYQGVMNEPAPNETKRADEDEDFLKMVLWTALSGVVVSLIKNATKKKIGQRFLNN